MGIRKSRGVTLLELLAGLSLVAILAGLAAPSLRQASRAGAVRAASYELASALAAARARAIVQARPTSLCPATADTCVGAGAAANSWRSFLEVDGQRVPLAGQSLPTGIEVRSNRSPLRFTPDALAASTGTLTICDVSGLAAPRAIVVSQTGRTRLTDAPAASCRS